MNDYCNGIAYATGHFAKDRENKYLVVRNIDKWYVDNISKETGYRPYQLINKPNADDKKQWIIKCYNISGLPELKEIKKIPDFCRAYIEIHGVIDLVSAKDRKGNSIKRLRLRIYGNKEILSFINAILPSTEKKLQFIKNVVEGKYTGETYALYYQSKSEILEILKWIDGFPKNMCVWSKWKNISG